MYLLFAFLVFRVLFSFSITTTDFCLREPAVVRTFVDTDRLFARSIDRESLVAAERVRSRDVGSGFASGFLQ